MATPSRLSRSDVDEVLRRAAEIEGAREDAGVSMAQLRSIGVEAGFSPETLERAIAEVQAHRGGVRRPDPVRRSGLVWVHVSAAREVPRALDMDQLVRVMRLFQPYRETPRQVELEPREVSWRDGKGIRFTVASAGGISEVRVYVSGLLLRRRRWMRWVEEAVERLASLAALVGGDPHPTGPVRLPPAPPGE